MQEETEQRLSLAEYEIQGIKMPKNHPHDSDACGLNQQNKSANNERFTALLFH